MSIQALIAKKRKDIESKKAQNIKTHKPTQGKNMYRILPSWREANEVEKENGLPAPFFHDFSLHWIKTEKGGNPAAVYVCTERTFGRACEICEEIDAAYAASSDEDFRELLKESKSRQSYLLNALHRNGATPDVPVILEIGTTIFEEICELISEYGDITDLEEGVDIIINRQGVKFDTKYAVLPAKKSVAVDKSVLEKLHDLDAVVAQENATRQQAALKAIGKVTGVLPASLPASSDKQFLSDAKVEDAEFEEMSNELDEVFNDETVEAKQIDSDLDDDLEDLLADMG